MTSANQKRGYKAKIFYVGLVLLGPSIALKAGGLRAVIWTDVLQATIMLAGMLATLIIGIVRVGGLARVWQISDDWGRNNLDDPGLISFDPRQSKSIWSLVFIQSLMFMELYGSDQTTYQRYAAMRTIRQARWSIILSMFGAILIITIACLTGMVVFAYYADQGCDPLSAVADSNSNQIIPIFIMEVLSYPGLPGLFMSSILSAGLSSVSSCLCAISAVIWDAMVDPLIGHKLSERGKLTASRIIVVVFGVIGMVLGLIIAHIEGSIFMIAIGFRGCILGTTMGLFLFGALVPWINWKGIVTGSITGLSVMLWIMVSANGLTLAKTPLEMPTANCTDIYANYTDIIAGKVVPEPTVISGIQHVYTLSRYWYPLVGFSITAIVASLVSLVTGPTCPSDVDPKLTIHVFERFCCCLPEYCRRTSRSTGMSPAPILLDDVAYRATQELKSKKLISENGEQSDDHQESSMLDNEDETL